MNAKLLASMLVVGTLFTATSASAQSTNILDSSIFKGNFSNVGFNPVQFNNQPFLQVNDGAGKGARQSNVIKAPVKQTINNTTAPTTIVVQPAPVVVTPAAPKAPRPKFSFSGRRFR